MKRANILERAIRKLDLGRLGQRLCLKGRFVVLILDFRPLSVIARWHFRLSLHRRNVFAIENMNDNSDKATSLKQRQDLNSDQWLSGNQKSGRKRFFNWADKPLLTSSKSMFAGH